MALPARDWTVDISCVTKWTKLDTRWRGVSVDTLLEHVELDPEAAFVIAFCDGGYTTNLPIADRQRSGASSPTSMTASRSRRNTADRRDSSCLPATSGRAPNGSAASGSRPVTSPGSGNRSATTTAATPGSKSATAATEDVRRSATSIAWQLADRGSDPRRDAHGPLVHAGRLGLARSPRRPARGPAADGRGWLQRRAQLLDRVRPAARARRSKSRSSGSPTGRCRRSCTTRSSWGTASSCVGRSAATSSGNPRSAAPLLLVAGGSGVVPLMAMIRERHLAGSTTPTSLLLGRQVGRRQARHRRDPRTLVMAA